MKIATLEHAALAEGLQDFGIETDLSAEGLFEVATRAFSTSLYQAVKAGVAYMAAQEALNITDCARAQSGTFRNWIKTHGMTEERVYEVMRIAKGYLAIPAEQRKSYLNLSKYKALKLAKLEPEALAALADKDPSALDEISLMSRPEIETLVKNLKRNFDTVNNKKLALEDEVARLRPRTLMPGAAEFDARTFEVRHEAAGLEYGARIQMDALDILYEEVLADSGVDAETESLRLKAVGLAAGAMLARSLDLYERIREGLGGEMPVRPHGDLMLSNDEKDMLHAGMMLLNANFERERDARKAAVDGEANKHRTGPGRKKGSKNKKGAES